MKKHFNRYLFILLFLILMSLTVAVIVHRINEHVLTYDEYLSKMRIEYPLSVADSTSFNKQEKCTPILEERPFKQTIDDALHIIKTNIDNDLYLESKEFLLGGIIYKSLENITNFPYSAYYSKKTIYLFDNLFDYGCVEDVVSTLVHELIHVVQNSRYEKDNYQIGERDLNKKGIEKILSEIEADNYQLYVSNKLKLVGEEHLKQIISVSNKRRLKYNSIIGN